MTRRTHYIPVGNLQLDGVSIDPAIYCPANGYPDPNAPETLEQYCPAHGYYDPTQPIPYIPDPAIPAIIPDDGTITLIMTTQMDAAISASASATYPFYPKWEIYGAGDQLIYSETGNAFFYEFPSSGGIGLKNGHQAFKIVISSTGTPITSFQFTKRTGYASAGWPVLEAHIKCASLTSLYRAFLAQKMIGYVKLYGAHNSLMNMSESFKDCTEIKEIQMNVELNSLSNLYSAFFNTPELDVLTLPESMPELTDLYNAFRQCGLKTQPPLPAHLPKVYRMSYAYMGMERMTMHLKIPSIPIKCSIIGIAQNCTKITKASFLSGMLPGDATTTLNAFTGCTELLELDMGNETWGDNAFLYSMAGVASSIPNLRTIKLPPKFIGINPTAGISIGYNDFSIKSLNTADWSECDPLKVIIGLLGLISFNQPTLKCNLLDFRGTFARPALLESIEVDWGNSTFTSGINLSYCNLDSMELDRIFNVLPAVAATINVTQNPGYATCDKTIATAKGWTVL